MTMGEKIQLLRKREKWSQETLAEKLSVSRQAVSLWERDESQPELDKLLTLARLFSVTTDYLIDDSLEEPASPPNHQTNEPAAVSTKQQKRFIQILSAATILDAAGLLLSALLWKEYQKFSLLIPGLMMQLISLGILMGCWYHSDLPQNKALFGRWLGRNLWFLLPIPVLWLSRFLFSLLPFPYFGILPDMLALILYLTICPLSVRMLNKP